MSKPHPSARRGHSTSQVPNLPHWTIQDEQTKKALVHSSRSVEQLYMNSSSMDKSPRVGKDEDVYRKFYSLAKLANTFELPQSARVVEGYDGPTEASKIFQDSILLVCFKKETKVVLAEDAYRQMTYSIPRESSLMYIPMDPAYGIQGHVYGSVEELLTCTELPKVVHIDAKTAFTLRLHSGDQLIFPARKEPNTFGKSCLVCYDQKDNKFTLPASQQGPFSTKPDEIRMYMDDCIKFIRKFPIMVALCDINNTMPPGTDGSFFTLTAIKSEESVVVKTKLKGEEAAARVIEMSLDTPIKLQCLQTAPPRSKIEAKEVFDTYRNAAVENRCNLATTESTYQLQHQLYMNVKAQTTTTQTEAYVTMRRTLPTVSESDQQKRHTSYEPIYENLVEYPTLPPKPPKPQRSQTSDDGGRGYQAKQSVSLPIGVKLSAQKDTQSVPQTKATHKVMPPHSVPQPTPVVTSAQSTHHVAKPQPTPTVAMPQPTHHVAKPQPTPTVASPQPIHVATPAVASPQPTRRIVKPQPTPTNAPPQSTQPAATLPKPTHSIAQLQPAPKITKINTIEDDQPNDEIYTVIPGAEVQDDSDDYVHVPNQPTVNVEVYQQQKQRQKELQRMQKLEASNEELRMQVAQVTTKLTQVMTHMAQLEASVAQILQLVVTRKPEDNIKQLSFLDADKVLMMLQAMGLSMYEHIFREHKVDGIKMTRLDSKKLSQYGITNPQDQTKLTDVIKGTISPLSYLLQPASTSNSDDTYDNYVRFTKT